MENQYCTELKAKCVECEREVKIIAYENVNTQGYICSRCGTDEVFSDEDD